MDNYDFDNTAKIDKWLLRGVAGIIILMVGGCVVKDALAHDAIPTAAQPQGWSYPLACCSGYDCREVTGGIDGLVHPRNDGYEIATTGEFIPLGDPKIKPSPDGQYHWCSQGGRDNSDTICLFVPPRVF